MSVVCGCCCSLVQAIAAAQAGVSVIQPNIGRLDDWYAKHPGVIRDPKASYSAVTMHAALASCSGMTRAVLSWRQITRCFTVMMVLHRRERADVGELCCRAPGKTLASSAPLTQASGWPSASTTSARSTTRRPRSWSLVLGSLQVGFYCGWLTPLLFPPGQRSPFELQWTFGYHRLQVIFVCQQLCVTPCVAVYIDPIKPYADQAAEQE